MMTPRTQVFLFSTVSIAAALATIVVFARGSQHVVQAAASVHAAPTATKPATGAVQSLEDAPLANRRAELLELAFDAASLLPTNPHVRNRCRMQETVASTYLELAQPRRALSCTEKIDNWRRGTLYADLARFAQAHGDVAASDRYLELADEVAERKTDPNAQEWPAERIKAKIADVLVARTPDTHPADYDAQLAALDDVVQHGGFEEVRAALTEYAKLYDANYADEKRREAVVQRIESCWSKVALQIQFETVLQLAEAAAGHADHAGATKLISRAREMLMGADFLVEDRLPLVAELVTAQHRCGDVEGARAEIARALALYDSESAHIVNIYRARCLRSLAEGYHLVGDDAQALALYARAVEAGQLNPNSRPRADDLVATCCSMAHTGVEPDEALMKRLLEIRATLGHPW